jgi:hypothetical protein
MDHVHSYALSLLFAACSVLAFWLAKELQRVRQLEKALADERKTVRMMLAVSAPAQVAAIIGYQPAVDRVVEAKENQDLHDILLSRGG